MSVTQDNIKYATSVTREAASKSGRSLSEITLLAVSKRVDVGRISQAVAYGHTLFGESRVQEALEKIPLLPSHLTWHFIGRLQKNKIRKILPHVAAIHSVDSLETAIAVDRIADDLGVFPEIYLQINLADEASKQGFKRAGLESAVEKIAAMKRVQLLGLMAIPPAQRDPEDARPHFAALRTLRDELELSVGFDLPGLSMGMSSDYPIAVEEGATIVRLGSTIFGERPPPASPQTNTPTA